MKPKSLSDSFVNLFRFHRAQHSNHSIALIPITLTHFPNDCVRISVFKEVVRLQGPGVVSFELRVATSECIKAGQNGQQKPCNLSCNIAEERVE